MQNFGGQTRCITGYVQMVNWKSYRGGSEEADFSKRYHQIDFHLFRRAVFMK